MPQVLVADARAAMAPVAARFWGDPTARAAGGRDHRHQRQDDDRLPAPRGARGGGDPVGPAGHRQAGGRRASRRRSSARPRRRSTCRTTFRRMLEGGDRACAMEVSSHALALHRVDAIHFELALFTNLTQDHLDFHADMEDYFLAKRRLFAELGPEASVVNVDDPYGRRLAEEFECLTFSAEGAEADFSARDVTFDALGRALHGRRARGRDRGAHAAARPLQRRQRARRLRRGDRAGSRPGRGRRRAWPGRARVPGPLRADRRGPGLRRPRRLRPHARLARQRAAAPPGG